MNNPASLPHVRVGLAWTAYIAPVIIGAIAALVGLSLIVGSIVASSAMADQQTQAIVVSADAKQKQNGSARASAKAAQQAAAASKDREAVREASKWSLWSGIGIVVATALAFIYSVMVIRSTKLYTDAVGVWLYKGILPRSKGLNGVKWRDLEGAGYFSGFLGWLLRSGTVRVSHRFTKSSEIVVRHVPRGPKVAGEINALHHEILAMAPAATGVDAPR